MKNTGFCLLFGLLGLMQISCTNENEVSYQLKTTTISLYSGRTLQLEVTPATSGWTFSSKNSNIASVSESGLLTTHYMGTTMVYASHETGQFVDSVQVTVNPEFTLFTDPYLNFFASETAVINHETDYLSVDYILDPKIEGAFTLEYRKRWDSERDIQLLYYVIYHFNPNGALDYSLLSLPNNIDLELADHVSERYMFLGVKNYTLGASNTRFTDKFYISPDSSKLICVTSEGSNLIHFHPYTLQSMEAIKNDTIGMVFEINEKLWR